MRLTAAAGTNAAVAGTIFLSPTTVKRYVSNILAKLGASNGADDIAYAFRAGLARSD